MNGQPEPEPVLAVAFNKAVAEHADSLKSFAARMMHDEGMAEDVAQDSFLALYRHLHEVPVQAFRPWLFRMLVNRCRTAASQRRARRSWTGAAPIDEAAAAPDGAALALRSRLARAIAGLDAPHREAFLLKLGEGLPYDEIARITGVGVSALKMRVKRARDQVRARWEELEDHESHHESR